MPTFTHGKRAYFSLDSNDLTSFLDSADFSPNVDMAETSTLGNDSKTYIPGLRDATLSISGRWSSDSDGPDDILYDIMTGEVPVPFEYGPEGSGNGDVRYTGDCYVTSFNVTAPVGDVTGFSADIQVTGDVTKDTFTA